MGTDDITQKMSDDQFNQIMARLHSMEQKVDGAVSRLDSLEDKVDKRFMNTQPLREILIAEFQSLNSKVDGLASRVDGLESKLESKLDDMHEDLGDKMGVIGRTFLEIDAKYGRIRQRLTNLEQKADNPV
jgi:tetrahydromethanopterin S-methyltransferase subunit G